MHFSKRKSAKDLKWSSIRTWELEDARSGEAGSHPTVRIEWIKQPDSCFEMISIIVL